ncbi:MAG: UPF0175 family protein [Leptospiraceae bacterium]|nr:UPF0175 family protein [Leptospiraceae bacterium]
MIMEKMEIEIPDNFDMAVGLTKEELNYQIRLMAALKMFELGKISSGKAARLIGITRVDFLDMCGRYRVSIFNYPPEEAIEEIEKDIKTLETMFP